MKYHYKGVFVVVRADGAYLADDRRPEAATPDGWTSERSIARAYKLRAYAERAARRWGGEVRQEQ